MLKRLGNTVDTLKKLPRWNGHFYNWYDTETLKPLHPIYVSTVDSGNLVVYLLAVRQGIIDCLEKTVLGKSVLWDCWIWFNGKGSIQQASGNTGLSWKRT